MIDALAVISQLEEAFQYRDVEAAEQLLSTRMQTTVRKRLLEQIRNPEITRLITRQATGSVESDGNYIIAPVLAEFDQGTFSSPYSFTLVREQNGTKILDMSAATNYQEAVRPLPQHALTQPVKFQLTQAETGQPIAGRISIRDEKGNYWPPRGHQRHIRTGWRQDVGGDVHVGETSWAYVPSSFTADLPTGHFTIEVQRGMEYRPVSMNIDVSSEETGPFEVQLSQFIDMNALGWYSGDTHTHFLSEHSALLEAKGENLNIVNVLATSWRELITDVESFTGAQSRYSSDQHIVYVNEETRHGFLGHAILHPLKELVYPLAWGSPGEGVAGGYDYPPIAIQADMAHAQGAIVTWAHFPGPTGELMIDAALGKIDSIDLLTFSDPLVPVKTHLFSLPAAADLWYAMLNTGIDLPASAGTDKMMNTQVTGSVRTYVYLHDNEALTYRNWANGIKRGNTFVTSGPFLFLSVNGSPIGSHLTATSGESVEVHAEVKSIHPVKWLEIVKDGVVISRIENPNRETHLTTKISIPFHSSGWIAARAYDPELTAYQRWPYVGFPGMPRVAHTSPVYVSVDGQPRISAKDATLLIQYCDRAIEWVNETARFKLPSEKENMLQLFQLARSYYERQIE